MNKNIYIGAMSGTSHDAVDVSIIEVINSRVQLKYFYSLSLPIKLKTKVRNAIESNHISLTDLGKLNKEIGFLFSKAINLAIDNSNIKKSKIVCASISGQTIRHEINKKYPFSMQIGDPNVVSKEINLPVVSDFRNMHIALGGDGAPLVTEFHNQIFYKPKCTRIILNIGGISNYSYVNNKTSIWGSDVGPGNAIMDAYCDKFLNKPFDRKGSLASKGTINKTELRRLLKNSFFKKSFPKSTGKELFNLNLLSKKFLGLPSEDVLATLAEFTAESFALAIKKNNHLCSELIVCGGGSKNEYLLGRIKKLLNVNVMLSNQLGVDAQSIESMAFAWLGYKRINEENLKIQLSANKFTRGLLGSVVKSKR
jgi:anhydro-N-acetylmuramic acid kinase